MNKEQEVVVKHIEGHGCVLAIPGSGKTRTVVTKIEYILQGHEKSELREVLFDIPQKILVLTYTRAAAVEIKERVEKNIKPEAANRLRTGTFHSVFGESLNKVNAAFMRNTLINEEMQKNALERAIELTCQKHLETQDVWERKRIKKEISIAIGNARSRQFHSEGHLDIELANGQILQASKIAHCLDTFRHELNSRRWRDQEMTLEQTLIYLKDPAKVERIERDMKYRERNFRNKNGREPNINDEMNLFSDADHVIVDEAQDMDRVQLEIVLALKDLGCRVDILGDDDQSIYGFRSGLGYQGMLEFIERTGAKKMLLQSNYRSNADILTYANEIITQVDVFRREKKDLIGVRGNGEYKSITLDEFPSDDAQLLRIAQEIADRESRARQVEKKSTAVIARNNMPLDEMEIWLTSCQVPYQRLSKDSIWNTDPIIYLVTWLNRMVAGNLEISEWLKDYDKIFPQVDLHSTENSSAKNNRKNLDVEALDVIKLKLQNFTEYYFESSNKNEHLTDYIFGIYDYFRKAIKVHADASFNESRYEYKFKLLRMACEVLIGTNLLEQFEGLFENSESENKKNGLQGTLAARMAVISRIQASNPKKEEREDSKAIKVGHGSEKKSHNGDRPNVYLMTTHGSKGLEYEVVWFIGLENQTIPNEKSEKDHFKESLRVEEECRILYVGITRAKNELHMSWARKNTVIKGKMKQTSLCVFINRLPQQLDKLPYFEHSGKVDRFTI